MRAAVGSAKGLSFAIPWTAFAVYWEWSVLTNAQSNSSLHGHAVPSILFGLWMMSAPIRKFWLSRRTVYALTNKRLTIIDAGLRSRVKSTYPGDVISIERKRASGVSVRGRPPCGTGNDSADCSD
jgi:hypothetical protein